jgi:hypothetical protein
MRLCLDLYFVLRICIYIVGDFRGHVWNPTKPEFLSPPSVFSNDTKIPLKNDSLH